MPLQSYIRSFRLPSGTCVHAFAGGAVPLSRYDYRGVADSAAMTDAERRRLIFDLLGAPCPHSPRHECAIRAHRPRPTTARQQSAANISRMVRRSRTDAVNCLHSRGSAHLGLDAESVRVAPPAPSSGASAPPDASRLKIIGLGAAVKLQSGSGRSAFRLDNQARSSRPGTAAARGSTPTRRRNQPRAWRLTQPPNPQPQPCAGGRPSTRWQPGGGARAPRADRVPRAGAALGPADRVQPARATADGRVVRRRVVAHARRIEQR
eukprot:3756795-Prymnesium_polylepis.1